MRGRNYRLFVIFLFSIFNGTKLWLFAVFHLAFAFFWPNEKSPHCFWAKLSTHTKSIRSETESNKKVHFYFNLFIVFIFAEFFLCTNQINKSDSGFSESRNGNRKQKPHNWNREHGLILTRLVDAAIATIRRDDNHCDCAVCTMEIEIYVQHEIEVLHEKFQQ